MFALKYDRKRYYLLSAIAVGLAIGTKLNTATLFFLFPILYVLYKKRETLNYKKTATLAIIFLAASLLTFFLTWPRIWGDTLVNISEVFQQFSYVSTVPEYFLGGLEHPYYYYFAYFFASTPAVLLLLLIPALHEMYRNRKKNHAAAWIWMLVPIIIFSFAGIKQSGIKNFLLVYPVMSVLCAVGIMALAERLKKYYKYALPVITGAVMLYLVINIATIHPFYLDYYNELTGGPKNVYENRMFAVGWWGEGIGEATYYLMGNAGNRTVQFYIMPRHVIPPHNLTELDKFVPGYLIDRGIVNATSIWYMDDIEPVADYIVENTFYRWYIDDPDLYLKLSEQYELVHTVEAAGAPLAWVYRKTT
jgi:hypothetical protein